MIFVDPDPRAKEATYSEDEAHIRLTEGGNKALIIPVPMEETESFLKDLEGNIEYMLTGKWESAWWVVCSLNNISDAREVANDHGLFVDDRGPIAARKKEDGSVSKNMFPIQGPDTYVLSNTEPSFE